MMLVDNNIPIDLEISDIVENNKPEDYSKVLNEDERFEIQYHLSPLRESLVNWIPFKKTDSVLEIGGAFGEITHLLCERCGNVVSYEKNEIRANAIKKRCAVYNNLEVINADYTQNNLNDKYDYVIALGIVESQNIKSRNLSDYASIIKKLMSQVKEDGKLLLAVENRLGVRYLCGATSSENPIPFLGINKYEGRKEYLSFSKTEILNILDLAEVGAYKIYYPFPDYRFTQAIFSDGHLPNKSIRDKVIPYYSNKESLVASELDLMDDMIENGTIGEYANSFLLECVQNAEFMPVDSVMLSTDRGREFAVATLKCEDKIIKRPLYREGMDDLHKGIQNIFMLEQRGVPVVKHEILDNGDVVMPFVNAPVLMEYLRKTIRKDVNMFIQVLDKVWDNILNSSDVVSDELNFIEKKKHIQADWGPVLKEACIDMVPMNSFWMDDKVVYFDQEYVRENCPAKYVMFRVLLYIYINIVEAEAIYPRVDAIARFGITDEIWNACFDTEAEFVASVRQYDLYRCFHKMSQIDKGMVLAKADSLLGFGFHYDVYDIDRAEKLDTIKATELQILLEFDRVCRDYNINYCLMYGTLLGAVRHKGFIPWDDDVDVAMLRDDYNRFICIASEALGEEYFLQTPETDPEAFFGGYAKLRLNTTTGIEPRTADKNCNKGMWIDIFPLDDYDLPDESAESRLHDIEELQVKIADSEAVSKADWDKLNGLVSKQSDKASYVTILTRRLDKIGIKLFRKQWFMKMEKGVFEGHVLPVPSNSDKILKIIYGMDCLRMPVDTNVRSGHEGIYKTDVAYEEFESHKWNESDSRKIVLLGEHDAVIGFIDKHCSIKTIKAFVTDNESLWGTQYKGVLTDELDALEDLTSDDSTQAVICGFNVDKYENVLRKKNIKDYSYYYVEVKDNGEGEAL